MKKVVLGVVTAAVLANSGFAFVGFDSNDQSDAEYYANVVERLDNSISAAQERNKSKVEAFLDGRTKINKETQESQEANIKQSHTHFKNISFGDIYKAQDIKLTQNQIVDELSQKYSGIPKPAVIEADSREQLEINAGRTQLITRLGSYSSGFPSILLDRAYANDELIVKHEYGHFLNINCLAMNEVPVSTFAEFELPVDYSQIESCGASSLFSWLGLEHKGKCYNTLETVAMMFVDYEKGKLPKEYEPMLEKMICKKEFSKKAKI